MSVCTTEWKKLDPLSGHDGTHANKGYRETSETTKNDTHKDGILPIGTTTSLVLQRWIASRATYESGREALIEETSGSHITLDPSEHNHLQKNTIGRPIVFKDCLKDLSAARRLERDSAGHTKLGIRSCSPHRSHRTEKSTDRDTGELRTIEQPADGRHTVPLKARGQKSPSVFGTNIFLQQDSFVSFLMSVIVGLIDSSNSEQKIFWKDQNNCENNNNWVFHEK